MTDNRSSPGAASPFDICEMIVSEEFYLDEENPPSPAIQSYGYAARDRIRAAKREADTCRTVGVAQGSPNPAKYWQDMYTDLLRRVGAGEFAQRPVNLATGEFENQEADPAYFAPAQARPDLWACTGCGSQQTMDQIKGEHPGAISCCPERKMAPLSASPPSPVAGERADRLEDERNRLQNSYGSGPFADGLITRRIAEIDKELSSPPPETTRNLAESICDDCPPAGYPTDKTRCLVCPRRTSPISSTDGGTP